MLEELDREKTGSLSVMVCGDILQHMTDQVFQGKGLLPGRALLIAFLLRTPPREYPREGYKDGEET